MEVEEFQCFYQIEYIQKIEDVLKIEAVQKIEDVQRLRTFRGELHEENQ